MLPSAQVLDLYAVPGATTPLPGGQGASVLAGDLVLSPDRDPAVQAWLSPVLARLAVGLDENPARTRRDLRVAMPVPARDGSWVVEGWGASRWEPGTTACDDLGVTLAAGRLLHARLASAVPAPPDVVLARQDRWALAERAAFEAPGCPARDTDDADDAVDPVDPVVASLWAGLADADPADLGPSQLVHADLTGNVLLDVAGAPVVIDVAPAWRPVLWAEAVATLDAVVAEDADAEVLRTWSTPSERQALLRAALYRVLAEEAPGRPAADAYAGLMASTAST